MADFEKAVEELLEIEGGNADLCGDPGKFTRFGISSRSYPNVDIKNLQKEQAKEIYLRDFWLPCGCDTIADQELAEEVFKAGVNCGNRVAIKRLQISINDVLGYSPLQENGILGSDTRLRLAEVEDSDEAKLLRRTLELEIIKYYASLKNFNSFGRGWVHRVVDC